MQTLRKHVVSLAGLFLIAVSIFLSGGGVTFAATPDITIDNGDPGFSTQGLGWSAGGGGGYHNNYLMHGPLLKGLPAQKAVWEFRGLPDGIYRIWVSWKGVPSASTKALFSAFDGAVSAGSFTIDETQDPPQALNIQRWAIALPSVQVHSGTFRVELPAMEKGMVIADAIKVIRIPAAANIVLLNVKSKTKTTGVLFTQSFSNLGPDPADSFFLWVETIPQGLLFDPANSDKHCSQTKQSIACAGVPSNTDINVSLIPDPGAPCSPTASYTVRFSSSEADPAPANNRQTIVASVICPPSTLTLEQKPIGTLGTAVKNQKNVNLLRFEGQAAVTDILATQFVFSSASGSLNNGENYTLRVDTDNDGKVDTILQEGVSAQTGEVTFGKLTGSGFVFPQDKRVTLEVHADISASLTNNWLQLEFATGNTHYVEAKNVVTSTSLSGIKTDGVCASSCDIIVTTTASEAYRLVSQGDLYVTTQDTVTTGRHQFLGGVLGAPVLQLNFHAENEDIDVTDLQLTATGSTASSVDHLELYALGAATPFATASIGACGSDKVPANTRCAKMQSQQLVILKGQDVNVLVNPFMKTDVNGAISGEKIQLYLAGKPISNNATGEGAVRARGVQSSNSLSASNENRIVNEGEVMIGNTDGSKNKDIIGVKHVSVLSKITSITNAGSDTGIIPTGVADIGQFKIVAAAHDNSQNGLNKVVLSGVLLTVNAVNVDIDATSLRFFNKADATSTLNCTPYTRDGVKIMAATISGSFLASCTALTGSSVSVSISQGTDATFVLRMTVTNPKISPSANSTLQVSLQNFADATLTTFGATKSHFAWIDQDNASATTSSFTWTEYPDATVKSTLYQN
ncbi:hypothetical protein HY213_01440 [Candidatus Peregrinibacteria bacterium]|nr:hypothetical protein [Candidatus Peregrinibacteria bacterium]